MVMAQLPQWSRTTIAALLVLAGCGGGGADAPIVTPPPPTVRSVTITPSSATVRVGETQGLSALVDAINGAATTVTWSSESPTRASVSASGVVTGLAAGTAIIRATSTAQPSVSGTASIQVQAARSITVSPSVVSIGSGQTAALTAVVQLDAGLPTTVTWRTSAAGIATVSSSGVVTGVAQGTAQITAIATADTTLRASSTVNVVPSVRSITVTPTTATLNSGDTRQITATVVTDPGVAQTVTWRSANNAIATVSATGLVTAVAVGSTTVTALSTVDTLRRASATITVAPRTLGVTISPRSVSLNPGTSTTLTANVTADPGVNTAVTWSSSAGAVATVSAQGVVTGVAVGSTIITAALVVDPSRRDTVTVNVLPRLASTWTASRLNGPLHDDVVSVATPDVNSVFAVNSTGDVYRWNGSAWSVSATGTTYGTTFYAVHASSATNVIAVGANGVIARWNGSAWTTMTSGTTRALYAVWVENATTAWAAGENGTILRLATNSWSTESSGTTRALYGLWAGDNVVYAVGADGVAVRRTGTTWASVTLPSSETLYGVHGLSASDVVLVGAAGTILRFDGATWSVVATNGLNGDVFGVTGSVTAGRRYLVGDGGVAEMVGTTVAVQPTPYAPRMFAVALDPTNSAWASGQRGLVMRSGTTWTTNNIAPDLLDVWSTSSTNAIAVGEFGFAYRWTGSTWTRLTTPSTVTLTSVWAASATDAFIGGENGTMLRWNGTQLTTMTVPTTSTITAIWGSSATNVFATTRAGEVLRYSGNTWTVSTTQPNGLWAVYGSSVLDVFVAGENGSVLRLNGASWTTVTAPGGGTVGGLWLTSPTNVFAVGATTNGTAGAAYLYGGTAWSSLQVGSTQVLTSIWGPSVNDLYATGQNGLLLRYNGNTWTTVSTGTTDLLWSMSAAANASGGAFAVGINSTVVAGTNGAALRTVTLRGPGNLDPAPGAATRRKIMPSGAARLSRQRR